jgi:hypothetical protein
VNVSIIHHWGHPPLVKTGSSRSLTHNDKSGSAKQREPSGDIGRVVSGDIRYGRRIQPPFQFGRVVLEGCRFELSPNLLGAVVRESAPINHVCLGVRITQGFGTVKSVNTTTNSNATNDTMMKHQTLLVTFLSVAAFTLGCEKADTPSQQLAKVRAKDADAAKHEKEADYTYAQKTEFTTKMQSQLADINKDLELLAAKIEKSSDAVKAEAKPKLLALREQKAVLNKQLDEAKNATESTWDSVKATSKKAYNDLKDGFAQARQWVSEKIAP